MCVLILYTRMSGHVVPMKGHYLTFYWAPWGLKIWVSILRTTFLGEPPGSSSGWGTACVGKPVSSWCGLSGKAVTTLGFNFLTYKAEIKVPTHLTTLENQIN